MRFHSVDIRRVSSAVTNFADRSLVSASDSIVENIFDNNLQKCYGSDNVIRGLLSMMWPLSLSGSLSAVLILCADQHCLHGSTSVQTHKPDFINHSNSKGRNRYSYQHGYNHSSIQGYHKITSAPFFPFSLPSANSSITQNHSESESPKTSRDSLFSLTGSAAGFAPTDMENLLFGAAALPPREKLIAGFLGSSEEEAVAGALRDMEKLERVGAGLGGGASP